MERARRPTSLRCDGSLVDVVGGFSSRVRAARHVSRLTTATSADRARSNARPITHRSHDPRLSICPAVRQSLPAKAWRRPRIRWPRLPQSNFARRRQRRRCGGDRGGCAVRGRAADDRDRRRLLLPVAKPDAKPVWGYNGSGRGRRQAPRASRRREGHDWHRSHLDPCGDVAGCDRGLGDDPEGHGAASPRPRAGSGDLRYAEEFPVDRRASPDWGKCRRKLRQDSGATRHFRRAARRPKAMSSSFRRSQRRSRRSRGRPARVL